MFLLVEILDGTTPQMIGVTTSVDLLAFKSLVDAIIDAEPHYISESEEGTSVVVSEQERLV